MKKVQKEEREERESERSVLRAMTRKRNQNSYATALQLTIRHQIVLSYRTFRLQRFSIITTTSQAWFRLPRAWYCTKLDDYDRQLLGGPQSPPQKVSGTRGHFLVIFLQEITPLQLLMCDVKNKRNTSWQQ